MDHGFYLLAAESAAAGEIVRPRFHPDMLHFEPADLPPLSKPMCGVPALPTQFMTLSAEICTAPKAVAQSREANDA